MLLPLTGRKGKERNFKMRKRALLIAVFAIAGCGTRRDAAPIPSPDGSLMLRTHVELSRDDPVTYRCVVFEIRDGAGRVLHAENTRASNAMRWSMSWVGNDCVRLRSSDIGSRHWRRHADGRWLKEEAEKPLVGADD
jgi:hypothetical protein